MSEKTGNIEKILYDFNTAGVLEVFLPKLGWCRVTPNDFRSFDGDRRITEPKETIRGVVKVPMVTYKHYGRVYFWGTNKQVPLKNTAQIIDSPLKIKLQKISASRK